VLYALSVGADAERGKSRFHRPFFDLAHALHPLRVVVGRGARPGSPRAAPDAGPRRDAHDLVASQVSELHPAVGTGGERRRGPSAAVGRAIGLAYWIRVQAQTELIGGRYRLLQKIGEGGMGEVYLAKHIHIEKQVAIKLLRAEVLSNRGAVTRFRQEARSASSIGHKNIIRIDDFGALPDGRVFMVMEYLHGHALRDLMAGAALPLPRALDILIQVGRGLAAAHAKGITHRDLKPENIFVTEEDGRDVPKILDFGIAKVSGSDGGQNLTVTGAIFGTPSYMAPEQAMGARTDHRVDIYAMGVILYEVCCGALPFRADSFMGILSQHIHDDPVPPSQMAQRNGRVCPPALETIILRAMRKDPSQRYQSMNELVHALADFGGLELEQGQTSASRNRSRGGAGRWLAVAAALGLAVLGGGLYAARLGAGEEAVRLPDAAQVLVAPASAPGCPAGRTLLDGTCVSPVIASYVECIRATVALVATANRASLAAAAAVAGVTASTAAEVKDQLEVRYASVDDPTALEVIRVCYIKTGGDRPDAAAPLDVSQLRSAPSRDPVTLRFVNRRPRSVRLLWIQPDGKEVFYRELAPQGSWIQQSFTRHAWVVRDATTGAAVLAYPGAADATPQTIEIW
jgi:tRNA A-37 threonylcarbamoyl transferase component Bud32